MFKMDELSSYSIDVDLSKFWPVEEKQPDLRMEILEKLNLRMLKPRFFGDFRVLVDRLKDVLPSVEYRTTIGSILAEITIFSKKRIVLGINTTEMKTPISSLEQQKEEPQVPTAETLRAIGNDFIFLLGNVLGLFEIREPPNLEIRSVFLKKGKFLPSVKLKVVGEGISAILAKPKTNILGVELDFDDEKGVIHTLRFSQHKEELHFTDTFELKFMGPFDIVEVLESNLKLANEVCGKICEL